MAFPGPHARIDRNEEGEPTGWDYPSEPDPYDALDDRDDWRGEDEEGDAYSRRFDCDKGFRDDQRA